MKTYTSDHINECAKFIEENCYEPNILYGNHIYSDSDIYRTILGQYCKELNDSPDLIPSHLHNDTDIVDSSVYIDKWFSTYAKNETDIIKYFPYKNDINNLNAYVQKNEMLYNIHMNIVTHSLHRGAYIKVTHINNVIEYNGQKRGFNRNPITVYIEQNNKWIQLKSYKEIVKMCIECRASLENSLIPAIHTAEPEIFNRYLPLLYDETFTYENELLKLNTFTLYLKLNNIEHDSNKENIINFGINMNMPFAQTFEAYIKSSYLINTCTYPEFN